MSKTYPLTRFLVMTNALVFLFGAVYGVHNGLVQVYGFSMENAFMQQWELFVTAGFLHSDLVHLLYNMAFLWVFGRVCEDTFGRWKTGIIYIAAMVAGSLFFGILFPQQTAIGASGAVSGLVAAAILVEPGRDIYPATGSMPIVLLAVLFLIPTMVNAFNLAGNTANIAHIGGVFAGAILAFGWRPQQAWENMKRLWPLWAGIGIIVGAIIVSALY